VRRLITALLIVGALFWAPPSFAESSPPPSEPKSGTSGTEFVAGVGKDTLNVAAKKETQHQTGSQPESSHGKGTTRTVADPKTPPRKPTPFEQCNINWNLMVRCIDAVKKGEPLPEPTPGEPGTPGITITDLASFSPAPGTLTGEPDNLGVAGLPTNFTTDAAAHTRTGTLFGYPVTARFTPASFVFRYGDGQTRTATTAGKTWEALRVPQFTPTDTSHTYAERGTYQASVDTVYTAEIDLGTGYFPISGTLTIPGPPQSIQIYEARTALVAHTCDEDPTAEGCPGH